MVYRRRDRLPLCVMRYTGTNAQDLMNYIVHGQRLIKHRKEKTLEAGKLYHVTPRRDVRTLSPSQYARCLVHYSYVQLKGGLCSLAITYDLAVYLAREYPRLRFVSLLNYHCPHRLRHRYTLRRMLMLSPHHPGRRLKVWVPMDRHYDLFDLQPEDLPDQLVSDYLTTPDYYEEYELIWRDGLCGLLAYRQRVLLPTAYTRIIIHNYTASVCNIHGRWALYSLEGEHFISRFVHEVPPPDIPTRFI